jgi:hypothetical protein
MSAAPAFRFQLFVYLQLSCLFGLFASGFLHPMPTGQPPPRQAGVSA